MAPAGRPRLYPPENGKHLATLNLFREPDGSVHITVAGAGGARQEPECANYSAPIDYVDTLIIEAANNLRPRKRIR